jgi:hypothetical protein
MATRRLAINNLGDKFFPIQDHEPSNPSVLMSFNDLFFRFVEPHGFSDDHWSPIQVSNKKYSDKPCVQKLFSRMTPDEIFNLLNNLFVFDPEMYKLLKDLLTGEECDETVWENWIDKQSERLPSPYELGQLQHKIEISEMKKNILNSHTPLALRLSQNDIVQLLSVFYHKDERLMPGYVFPIPKSGLEDVIKSLSYNHLNQILDIFYHMNTSLYESFKRIITNQEVSVVDHRIYDKEVRLFPTRS